MGMSAANHVQVQHRATMFWSPNLSGPVPGRVQAAQLYLPLCCQYATAYMHGHLTMTAQRGRDPPRHLTVAPHSGIPQGTLQGHPTGSPHWHPHWHSIGAPPLGTTGATLTGTHRGTPQWHPTGTSYWHPMGAPPTGTPQGHPTGPAPTGTPQGHLPLEPHRGTPIGTPHGHLKTF